MNGKVKAFLEQRGYGFIKGEDGKDYFVHYSNLDVKPDAHKKKNLDNGEEVTFEPSENEKGLQALHVKRKE